MKRTHLLMTLVALVALTMNTFAQGPNDSGTYYAAADGKKGAELKTALHEIIRPHTKRSYNNLWTDFQTTDKKPNGKVWDMYSIKREFTFVIDQAGSYSMEGDVYNREHSFPNSWFGGSTSHDAYTDLNHLYPTDGKVNGMRSNNCFGRNNGESYQSYGNFSKVGACTYNGSNGVKCFEPNDIYKGDFARTYFYMVTCYEDEIPTWYTNYGELGAKGQETKKAVMATLDGNTYPGLTAWQLSMLMEWSENDPIDEPDVKETPRNEAVYSIQHNRNPFIDYPGLEKYIWGDFTDVAFSYNNYQVPTEIMTVREERRVHDNVMYNMAGQVVDKSYKGIVIMNGRKLMNK